MSSQENPLHSVVQNLSTQNRCLKANIQSHKSIIETLLNKSYEEIANLFLYKESFDAISKSNSENLEKIKSLEDEITALKNNLAIVESLNDELKKAALSDVKLVAA